MMEESRTGVEPKPDFSVLSEAERTKARIFVDLLVEQNSQAAVLDIRKLIGISIDGNFASSPSARSY